MKDELITIREKGQYETNTEYLEWIKQQIEKHNSVLMQKNSEISELKSKLSKLEAEKAKMEKSQSDSVITKTEIDLRAIIDDLNKVLSDNKNRKDDSRIDELISKVDRSLMEYSELANELKDIKAELSKPVNTGNIQYDIKRQQELEDMIRDIPTAINNLKGEIVEKIENSKQVEIPVPEFNNMEQAVNLVSNQGVQPDAEVPNAKSIVDQINNYESQINNDIDKEQNENKEEVVEENNIQQEYTNPFDQALNPVENTVENEVENAPVENNIEEPSVQNPEVVTPNVVPFVNNSETIAPDASILNSIAPQEEVPAQTNEENNVIEETTPAEVVQNNEEVAPIENPTPAVEPVQPETPVATEVPNDAEKVENVEEAAPELTEQAKQSMSINGRAIKARRGFVNKTGESEKITDIFHIDTWLLNNVELADDIKEYFNAELPSEVQEQSSGRSR